VRSLCELAQAADVPLFEEAKKKPRSEVKVYSLQLLEAQQEVCIIKCLVSETSPSIDACHGGDSVKEHTETPAQC
jgi:hypothetical protein